MKLLDHSTTFTNVGQALARYSVVLIFLAYGLFKFTAVEANAIAPLTENSPFLFWVNALFGRQGGSNLIGVLELIFAAMIAARFIYPMVAAIGSLLAAGALMTTLSFLFSTPGLSPLSVDAGFIVKDLTLLGVCLWSAGEALAAAKQKSAQAAPAPAGELRAH